MTLWRRLWRWFTCLFKPTYYIFPSIQAAMDFLPKRGGTLRLGPGAYDSGDGIKLPDKHVRIIGAGEETVVGVSGECVVKMDVSGSGGEMHLRGLKIQGSAGRLILKSYLALERLMLEAREAGDSDEDRFSESAG